MYFVPHFFELSIERLGLCPSDSHTLLQHFYPLYLRLKLI